MGFALLGLSGAETLLNSAPVNHIGKPSCGSVLKHTSCDSDILAVWAEDIFNENMGQDRIGTALTLAPEVV